MCKTRIIKLYICHDCHRRLEDYENFINYKNEKIFCENCFIDNIEKIDMSEFITRDIVIQDEVEVFDNVKPALLI